MSEAKKPSDAEKDQAIKIIRFTKIKQWFIPADADSYKVLRDSGIPLTRLHQDFIPTIRPVLQSRGVRVKQVDFKEEILHPFLDKVGTSWSKKPHTKSLIQARAMLFEVVHADGLVVGRQTAPKLQDVLSKFFSQWGYCMTFEVSESKGKLRIAVEYWFDPEREPIVVLAEAPEERKPLRLKLGNLRISFVFDEFESQTVRVRKAGLSDDAPARDHRIGYVHTTIESRQGGQFKSIFSSRCKYSDISNVLPLVAALMDVPNHNGNNFEVDAE